MISPPISRNQIRNILKVIAESVLSNGAVQKDCAVLEVGQKDSIAFWDMRS